jgi:segregation and condensation protein A
MPYAITLPEFTGPLDLLLRLIERAELDITTIALASVADQYLAHVRTLEEVEPRELAEFVSLAARLILIKSRALLPRAPHGATDPIDEDAGQLAAQLALYRRFKQVADRLRYWQEQGRCTFGRMAPPSELIALQTQVVMSYHLNDLLRALERRRQLQLPLDQPEAVVLTPRLTVAEVAARIRERLEHTAWFDFGDLLTDQPTTEEVIVAFWAMLELLKRRAIVIEQTILFGPIMIGRGVAPVMVEDRDE